MAAVGLGVRGVVLRCGGARGLGGGRAYADTWTRGYRLCLGVGLESMVTAVAGHLLDLDTHRGRVWGWRHCWLPLVLLRPGRVGSPVSPGRGLWMVLGRGVSRFCRGSLRHEGYDAGVGDSGEAICLVLLLPGLWWQRLDILEEVRGGLDWRCQLGAGLGLGLGLGSALGAWCGGGFGWLCGAGFGVGWVRLRVWVLAALRVRALLGHAAAPLCQ